MLQADAPSWKPLVESGALTLLMVWTDRRSPNYPDVPTLRELGYPFSFDSPFGIGGPKGMDQKVVAKLHDAFKYAIDDPGVLETLAKYDMVVKYRSTAEYPEFVKELTDRERRAVGQLGLAKTSQ
jgi:tripartite-type tricarboxylate transporter receptor subunit TctC